MSESVARLGDEQTIVVTVLGADSARPGEASVEIRPKEPVYQVYLNEAELGWINDQIRGLKEKLRIVEGR